MLPAAAAVELRSPRKGKIHIRKKARSDSGFFIFVDLFWKAKSIASIQLHTKVN